MTREMFAPALDRRGFLRLAGGGAMGAAALSVLNACAPAPSAPAGPAAKATAAPTAAAGASGSVLPTYVATTGGPKADYPAPGPLYQDAFLNYPANPHKAMPPRRQG